MVRVAILASSSSGNCTFLASSRTRILIDVGLSRRELVRRLDAIGEKPEDLDAILITHEHSDHVSGLVRVAKTFGMPVYMTRLAAPAIDWQDYSPKLVPFQAGTSVVVGDIEIESFTVPHDAIDPVGYSCRTQGVKVSVVTDLGYVPESVKYHVRGSDMVLLESNHDLGMLKVGPYPWSVKQRVMSRKGHLSNDVAAQFIRDDLDTRTSTIVLGHLSQHNNHPELVRMSAIEALNGRAVFTRLEVANPGQPGNVYSF